MSETARPVSRPVLSPGTRPLLVLVVVAAGLTLWRFLAGLGPVTGLNDGYPWGIWIAWDVVIGTALACGGYAVAILCYVLNRGRYHPLVRPAIVTSALGYSLAGVSIVIDVGRYWNLWKVVLWPGRWNLSSVLLEVALCVMAYVVVLWIELSPAFLERWAAGPPSARQRFAAAVRPRLEGILLWIVALGLLLPTMHQSSLGSVMLIAVGKLDPLWHTPLLPLLFLVSCVAMGYGVVVLESTLVARWIGRRPEGALLQGLARAAAWVTGIYLVLRLGDLAWRGQLARSLTAGRLSLFWVLETLCFLVALILLAARRQRRRPGRRLLAAGLLLLGGILYRFDTYLVGFSPGAGWHYFPTVPELLITLGIVALEVLLYMVIVTRLPILAGIAPDDREAPRASSPVPR